MRENQLSAFENLAELEGRILHETENLYLFDTGRDGLEIRLSYGTYSVLVGNPTNLETAKRAMERLEQYPNNLRKFLGVL